MNAPAERGTRERILEVTETFLAELGYQGTRLHRIAEQVGIQKASIFHYFPSKADLFRAVLERALADTEETIRQVLAVEGTPLERIRAMVDAYVGMVAAHRERTKIFLRQSLGDAPANEDSAASRRLLMLVVQAIEDGQRDDVFAPIDPVALVLGVVGMVAFFFTSAPALGLIGTGDPYDPSYVERIKHHVGEVVQRCLTCTRPRAPQRAIA